MTNGVNGYLFEPDDPDGAITATKSLLEATQAREELRRNARSEAEQWGWAAATKQLQSYYRSVLNAKYSVSAA